MVPSVSGANRFVLFVEVGLEFLGQLQAEAFDLGDLLDADFFEAADGTKGLQQGGAARGTDTGDRIQSRGKGALAAQLAMVLQGKAVGFVAQDLQQTQTRRGFGQEQGFALARKKNLFQV